MKKVILAVAVLFSVALVSCGSDKKANDSSVAVDTEVTVDSPVADSPVAVDTPAADTNK